MKICKNCRIEKKLEEYHKKKGGIQGCRPICIDCVNEGRRENYIPIPFVKQTAWNKGKETPLKVRKKQSISALGRKHSEQTKIKMSITRRGKSVRRNGWNYNEWRKKVLKRDKYECQKCKSKKNLHCHHIVPFKDCIKLRFEISNGQTLCSSCHAKIEGFQKGCIQKQRIISQETRKKMSDAKKGKKLNKEHKEKISDAMKGLKKVYKW